MPVTQGCEFVRGQVEKMSRDYSSINFYEDLHFKEAFKTLIQMREIGELCDVILVVNAKTIPAHRCVLAACSPYFRAMFSSGFMEVYQSKIALKEVDADAVSDVIDYFYTSELSVNTDNVEGILKVACLFQIENITQQCEMFLRRNITPSNCLGLQSIANYYQLHGLSGQASRYILWHFCSVMESDEFMLVPYEQLKQLIMDDSLKVQCEELVFDSVWSWINYDPKNRRKYVADIMQYVRFPLMNLKFLRENDIIITLKKNYTMCRELIREAVRYQSAEDKQVVVSTPRTKPRMSSEEIYVIGGWSNGQKMSTVQCFNVDTLEWSSVAGMTVAHVAREDYFRVVVVNEELYTVSRNKVGKYDPVLNKWIPVAEGPNMQCKWAGVCEFHNQIYIIGGHSSMCTKRFDPEKGEWESLCSMLHARYYPGVAVLRDKLYAVGGLDHLWAPLNTCERYCPIKNEWTAISPMSCARWSLGVAVLDDMLYAIGGSGSTEESSNSVEIYDVNTNTWSMSVSPMNNGRRCLGVAVVNGVIYVVGGRVVNSIEYYDKELNTWKVIGAVNARCNFGCVALRLL